MKHFMNTQDFNQDKLILLFGSQDCGVCTILKKRLDAWLEEHKDFKGFYIDINKEKEFSSQHQIYSIPVLQVYIENQKVIDQAGAFSLDKELDQLERILTIYNQ